ncbi:hypothetical protein HY091_02445 [Candidatus Kaiserbacteria bacterium]|nr:hypothetical protein [Candidatus Kaiserbacteria bacterium]
MASIQKRVARGVKLLDKKKPSWWRKNATFSISLSGLKMTNSPSSVLGQIYDDHISGCYKLNLTVGIGDKTCGFWCENSFTGETGDIAEARALSTEWRRVIRKRRAAEAT